MRIDLNPTAQPFTENNRGSAAGTVGAGSSAASKPTGGLGGGDQAEVSGAHLQVQALVAQASRLPEVREERVQALRQAVQRGHYQSSPEEVAGAVFTHMIAGPPV